MTELLIYSYILEASGMALALLCAMFLSAGGTGTSTPLSLTGSSVEMDIPLIHNDLDAVEYVSSQTIEEVHPGPNLQVHVPDTEHMDPCMVALRFGIILLMIAMLVLMTR